ncbi:MAG: AsmA family protein [Nitrospira sp. CR1.3]|nr:AsmA family protein [Nitrospira sp. CR1.3]
MKIVAGVLVVLILLAGALFSLPFLVDLAPYQDRYTPLIEGALNRKVQLQGIRLTLWPRIGARVQGFAIMDDPSFSSSPFASLSSLDVGVKLLPLLSGKVEVEEIALRGPVITVIRNKNGVTNVSTMGPTATTSPGAAQRPELPPRTGDPLQALALLAVDRVAIDGGQLTYRDDSTAPVTEYHVRDFELLLQSVRLGQNPTVHLSATVQPHNLPVRLDGSFGPLVETIEVKQFDLTLGLGRIALALKGALVGGMLNATVSSPSINTADVPIRLPLTKPVQVKDLRVVASAPYPLKEGVSAMELADVSDLSMALVMGNSTMHLKGTVHDGHAKVTLTAPSVNTADLPVETGLKKPVDVKNLQTTVELKGQDARLSSLSFELFNGQTKAQGSISIGSSAPPFNGKVTVRGVEAGPALAALSPDSPISVSGVAAMDMAVAGRGFSMPDLSTALEGPGHAEVKEGRIEGVNLVQEVVALLNIVGLPLDGAKATAFSTIESDFFIKQGIVRIQKLLLDSHDFQATGGGTVGFDQSLNLAVNLSLSQTLSQKIAGSSSIAKLAIKDGRLRLPLTVTGTTGNPSYGLNMKEVTGKLQEQVEERVKGAVKGLLEGTAKPEDLKQQGKDLLKDLFGR